MRQELVKNFMYFVTRYNEWKNASDFCSIGNNSVIFNDTCRNVENNVYGDCCLKDPQLYYFYRKALDISPSIEESGGVNGKLFGCLALAWVVVYVCIVKGVKSSGKVFD